MKIQKSDEDSDDGEMSPLTNLFLLLSAEADGTASTMETKRWEDYEYIRTRTVLDNGG